MRVAHAPSNADSPRVEWCAGLATMACARFAAMLRATLVMIVLVAVTSTGCLATTAPPRVTGGYAGGGGEDERDGETESDDGRDADVDDDSSDLDPLSHPLTREPIDSSDHDSADPRRGRRTPRGGPPVSELLAAAYAAAGLDQNLGGGFAARARLGGLVPWVSVRTGRDTSWHDEDPDVGRGTTLEVRATWRLDRLVFDPRELQVVALEAARRRERRKLATHVIRTYFVWKRSGSRADEAAAELDALTRGWFSEAGQRTASESRTAGGPAVTP